MPVTDERREANREAQARRRANLRSARLCDQCGRKKSGPKFKSACNKCGDRQQELATVKRLARRFLGAPKNEPQAA